MGIRDADSIKIKNESGIVDSDNPINTVITDPSSGKTVNVRDLSNTDALNVSIVDGSGDQITTFGGGTQYSEGTTSATLTGTVAMAEGPSDTITPLQVDASKNLQVDIAADSVGIGGGTQYSVDDVAGGTDTGTLTLVVRDDSLTTLTPADGDYTQLRVNSTGALHVTGGGGGTEYTEDEVTANPQVGTATLIERDDVLSVVTPIEGDWIGLRGTAEGALWVQDFNSDAMLTSLQLLDNAISGNEMQVDVITSALPTGASTESTLSNVDTKLGTIDTDTGNIATSTSSIDTKLSTTNTKLTDIETNTDALAGVTSTGTALDVNIAASAVTITADIEGDYVDDSAFTVASDKGLAVGGVFTTDTINSGDFGVFKLNADRELGVFVGEALPTGSNVIGAVTQSGTWNVTDISGTISLPTGAATEATLSSIDTDTSTIATKVTDIETNTDSLAVTGGGLEATALRVTLANDSTGVLSVDDGGGSITIDGTLTGITNDVSIDDGGNSITVDGTFWQTTQPVSIAGTVSVDLGANNDVIVSGDIAHDSADSGNPIKMGGKARQTNPTAVADNDRVDSFFDDTGKQVIVNNAPRDLVVQQHTSITSATETTILTAEAGVFHDLTKLVITNSSSTSVTVDIRDDSLGAVKSQFAIAPKGGIVLDFNTPWTQTAVNDNWTLQSDTAVSTLEVFVQAVKNI